MTEELTTDTFFLRLYEAGCTRDEVLESELRHLFLRHRAYEQRTRRQEIHLIGLRNEVRAFAGADPLERDDLYGGQRAASTSDDEEELQAFKYRIKSRGIMDWEEDLTE